MKFRQSKITKSVLQPTILTWAVYNYLFCALIYVFITNLYINNQYLFIQGIPGVILKTLVPENDADGW